MKKRLLEPGSIPSTSMPLIRRVASVLTALLVVFTLATTVTAEPTFEIVVPVSTVVRAEEGSVTILDTTETPEDLVGETCAVTAKAENQSSVHPDNDLVVEGSTQVVLHDVEAEPGGTVSATDTLLLGEEIFVSLIMGPDGVFSAGIDVRFDCPPEETTTTSEATTTTVEATTSSSEISGTIEATTTTVAGTTTSSVAGTTTSSEISGTTEATTTTLAGTTTSSAAAATTEAPPPEAPTSSTLPPDEVLEKEVLPFTGSEGIGIGFVALILVALGTLLVVGGRGAAPVPSLAVLSNWGRHCLECGEDAVFMTPHGRLCYGHTREALYEDAELWMPVRLPGRLN